MESTPFKKVLPTKWKVLPTKMLQRRTRNTGFHRNVPHTKASKIDPTHGHTCRKTVTKKLPIMITHAETHIFKRKTLAYKEYD